MALYFLALVPPPDLEEQIRGFKLEMKQLFGTTKALRLPAHITLQIPFEMEEDQEPFLEKELETVAKEQPPFVVSLNGFDCFPPRVIFVKVEEHYSIAGLHKRISRAVREIVSITERKKAKPIHPHINIASRDLKNSDFKMAWQDIKEREFQTEFLGDRFFLFRHDGRVWNIIHVFRLEG